jgi:hypothetical protein
MAENEIKVVCICVVIMYFCAPMTTALVSLLQFTGGPFFGIYSDMFMHKGHIAPSTTACDIVCYTPPISVVGSILCNSYCVRFWTSFSQLRSATCYAMSMLTCWCDGGGPCMHSTILSAVHSSRGRAVIVCTVSTISTIVIICYQTHGERMT